MDRFNRPLEDVLDALDRDDYYRDKYRQRPKLTRRQAAEAEKEEREMQFLIWCMINRFGEYNPLAYHD